VVAFDQVLRGLDIHTDAIVSDLPFPTSRIININYLLLLVLFSAVVSIILFSVVNPIPICYLLKPLKPSPI
jgi:hypothetical protein